MKDLDVEKCNAIARRSTNGADFQAVGRRSSRAKLCRFSSLRVPGIELVKATESY